MARDGKVRNEAIDTFPPGSIAANGARATAAPRRLTPGATRRRPSPDGARPSLAATNLKSWSAGTPRPPHLLFTTSLAELQCWAPGHDCGHFACWSPWAIRRLASTRPPELGLTRAQARGFRIKKGDPHGDGLFTQEVSRTVWSCHGRRDRVTAVEEHGGRSGSCPPPPDSRAHRSQ